MNVAELTRAVQAHQSTLEQQPFFCEVMSGYAQMQQMGHARQMAAKRDTSSQEFDAVAVRILSIEKVSLVRLARLQSNAQTLFCHTVEILRQT